MQENYQLIEQTLIIEDPELELDLHLPCAALPEHLYYEGGAMKAEMFYDKGVLHGPSTFFGEKGQLLTKTWYVQGKKMGKVRYFYESGAPYSLQRYKEGVLDGLQEYWYEDRTPKSLLHYSEGALHGEVCLFWPSGNLKRRCLYEKGVKIEDEFFNDQ
jgi:antitoxin component YwqK of YwqJK toxin-antitoxin module